MILASSLRRASEEPHSSTALNRLVEALFLPWSVSMSSDAPYWRPPAPRGQYGRSTGDLWSRSPFVDRDNEALKAFRITPRSPTIHNAGARSIQNPGRRLTSMG